MRRKPKSFLSIDIICTVQVNKDEKLMTTANDGHKNEGD
jgi:hypothetical protein